jgi:hypothetical protein
MNAEKSFEWIYNPFTRLAGWTALGLGLLAALLMAGLGAYSHVVFDGVIDVHFQSTDLVNTLSLVGISLASLILVFWVAGLIVAKPFRFIDLAGTMALAKAPFLIMALTGFLATPPDMESILNNPMVIVQDPGFLGVLILSLPVMVWSIVLMHSAYKVSCGLKGSTLTVSFIIALFVAEAVSKLLIYNIL